jgi:hypothetical protein
MNERDYLHWRNVTPFVHALTSRAFVAPCRAPPAEHCERRLCVDERGESTPEMQNAARATREVMARWFGAPHPDGPG